MSAETSSRVCDILDGVARVRCYGDAERSIPIAVPQGLPDRSMVPLLLKPNRHGDRDGPAWARRNGEDRWSKAPPTLGGPQAIHTRQCFGAWRGTTAPRWCQ